MERIAYTSMYASYVHGGDHPASQCPKEKSHSAANQIRLKE